jgi:hypothetical protein
MNKYGGNSMNKKLSENNNRYYISRPLPVSSERNTDLQAMYGKALELKGEDKASYEAAKRYVTESNLFDNIRKKQARIAKGSGEKMKKPNQKGYPHHLKKIAKEANESMKFKLVNPELLESVLNEKLATPKKGEEKDEFISRFMSSKQAKVDFPENKQRVAVAFSQWQRLKEEKFEVELLNQGENEVKEVIEADNEDDAITKTIDSFDVDAENIKSIEKLEEAFAEFLEEEINTVDKDYFLSLNESEILNEGKILNWVRWKLAKFSLFFLSDKSLNDMLEAYYSDKDGKPTEKSNGVSKMSRKEKIKKVRELSEKLDTEEKNKIINSSSAKQLEKQALVNVGIAAAAGIGSLISNKEAIKTSNAADEAYMKSRYTVIADVQADKAAELAYNTKNYLGPSSVGDIAREREQEFAGMLNIGADNIRMMSNSLKVASNVLMALSSVLFGVMWTSLIVSGVSAAQGLRKVAKASTIRREEIIKNIKNKSIKEFTIPYGIQSKPLNEAKQRHPMLIKYGVEGFNKPKATPSHKTKSHIVVAKKGEDIKVVRFGAQGVKGSPKKDGESEAYRKRREGFVARHKAQNPQGMKDKFSPLYWANKVKW